MNPRKSATMLTLAAARCSHSPPRNRSLRLEAVFSARISPAGTPVRQHDRRRWTHSNHAAWPSLLDRRRLSNCRIVWSTECATSTIILGLIRILSSHRDGCPSTRLRSQIDNHRRPRTKTTITSPGALLPDQPSQTRKPGPSGTPCHHSRWSAHHRCSQRLTSRLHRSQPSRAQFISNLQRGTRPNEVHRLQNHTTTTCLFQEVSVQTLH